MVLVCSILTNTTDYTDITDINITKKDQTIKQKAGYVKLPAMSRKFLIWQCNTSFFSSASVTVTRPSWLSHCKFWLRNWYGLFGCLKMGYSGTVRPLDTNRSRIFQPTLGFLSAIGGKYGNYERGYPRVLNAFVLKGFTWRGFCKLEIVPQTHRQAANPKQRQHGLKSTRANTCRKDFFAAQP